MGAGRVHQKGWLGHAVRIEGDSDRRGESLCSAARDGESSGGKDGGSFRVDLGEQRQVYRQLTPNPFYQRAPGSPRRIGCQFKHRGRSDHENKNLCQCVCSAPDHRLYVPATRPCPIGATGIVSHKLHRRTSGRPHLDGCLPHCRRTGTEDIPHGCQSVRRRYRE
jgi:hypothetical protein